MGLMSSNSSHWENGLALDNIKPPSSTSFQLRAQRQLQSMLRPPNSSKKVPLFKPPRMPPQSVIKSKSRKKSQLLPALLFLEDALTTPQPWLCLSCSRLSPC